MLFSHFSSSLGLDPFWRRGPRWSWLLSTFHSQWLLGCIFIYPCWPFVVGVISCILFHQPISNTRLRTWRQDLFDQKSWFYSNRIFYRKCPCQYSFSQRTPQGGTVLWQHRSLGPFHLWRLDSYLVSICVGSLSFILKEDSRYVTIKSIKIYL